MRKQPRFLQESVSTLRPVDSSTTAPNLLTVVAGLAAGLAMVVAAACGGSDDGGTPPGSVPVGGECRGYDECQQIAGKVVACRCTDESNKPICVVDAEEGESCGITGNFSLACRSGLKCVATDAQDLSKGSCMAPAKANEACTTSAGCEDPYYCGTESRCILGTAELGEECRWMVSATCKAPNFCSFGHVCTAPAEIGGSCSRSYQGERSECVSGATCDGSTCVALQSDGADCSFDEECSSGVCGLGQCGRGSISSNVVYGCGF